MPRWARSPAAGASAFHQLGGDLPAAGGHREPYRPPIPAVNGPPGLPPIPWRRRRLAVVPLSLSKPKIGYPLALAPEMRQGLLVGGRPQSPGVPFFHYVTAKGQPSNRPRVQSPRKGAGSAPQYPRTFGTGAPPTPAVVTVQDDLNPEVRRPSATGGEVSLVMTSSRRSRVRPPLAGRHVWPPVGAYWAGCVSQPPGSRAGSRAGSG